MRKLAWIGAALALGVTLWWYLFEYDALPRHGKFTIDWPRVRALAGAGGPSLIRTEKIAEGEFYGWMLAAGGGWTREAMEFRSYQLLYPGGQTIMIDAVHPRALHSALPFSGAYDDAAWARQQRALAAAARIVVTHEHFDHIGGLHALAAGEDGLANAFITATQRSGERIRDSGFSSAEIARLPDADYADLHRLAPGVVLIAAPGHTPGTQIVYVRLDDGAEYAFLGDIVWNAGNLLGHRAKSVLVGLLAGEDRAAVNEQISWLSRELRTTPVRFVIAHDPAWNAALLERGMLVEGFALD